MNTIVSTNNNSNVASPQALLFADTPDGFLNWIASPDGNANALADDGVTPLTVLAVEQRHTLGLAILLQHGGDLVPHAEMLITRQLDGMALLLLVQIGHVEMFTDLLKNGVDSNLKVKMGPLPVPNFVLRRMDEKMLETPMLHLLVESPDAAFVSAIIEAGADVNAVDSEGNTALHITATKPILGENGTFLNVEALLAKQADKTIKNRQGYTPVEYLNVFFNAVSPEVLDHPSIRKLRDMLTPEGSSSSIILLS